VSDLRVQLGDVLLVLALPARALRFRQLRPRVDQTDH
jgi:hypothetical protein